jgi:hypothetical protein
MAEHIEREALIRRLKASPLGMRDASGCFVKTGIIDLVKRQPAADVVEVRHGVWVETKPQPRSEKSCLKNYIFYKCSLCGRFEMHKEPYCNCGAKMDGKGEDNGA